MRGLMRAYYSAVVARTARHRTAARRHLLHHQQQQQRQLQVQVQGSSDSTSSGSRSGGRALLQLSNVTIDFLPDSEVWWPQVRLEGWRRWCHGREQLRL